MENFGIESLKALARQQKEQIDQLIDTIETLNNENANLHKINENLKAQRKN